MLNGPKKNRLKYLYAAVACIFFVSTIPTSHASVMTMPCPAPSFQKGMCYVTWNKDGFASQYSAKALEMLKDMGVDYIQVNVTQYQETYDSTQIHATDLTPSDSSIKHTLKTAHKLGMKTMLKPHIDLIKDDNGSYWRADIGFYKDADWEKWFKSYKKFITHYAKIAERNEVDVFCVGTELSFASQKTEQWKEVISEVKKVYSGKLIYAANWDNFKNIKFWGDLDYMGIDAYFPLTYKQDPDIEEIKSGWEKWAQEIESWATTEKKPVVFTEIGYASSPVAPAEPWKNGTHGNADVEIQAKCYTAFFETVWNKPWLAGVYWWKWSPSIYGGGKNNRRFTPMNKPAAEILSKHYTARITATGNKLNDKMLEQMTQKRKAMEMKLQHREQGANGMVQENRMPQTKK